MKSALKSSPSSIPAAADSARDAASRSRRSVLAGVGALLLAGCSTSAKVIKALTAPEPEAKPEPEPTRIVGALVASADINPDLRKRASPLLVRVYELKSDAAFNNADFMALFQRDQAELAADIVLREEFIVQPGERRVLDRVAGEQTRFLAVFAAYRDIERARWRALAPVRSAATQTLQVQVDASAVSITPAR